MSIRNLCSNVDLWWPQYILSDTKVGFALSVAPKNQRNQVHQSVHLEGDLIFNRCIIWPHSDQAWLKGYQHVNKWSKWLNLGFAHSEKLGYRKKGKKQFFLHPDLRSKKVTKATHLQSALIDECQKRINKNCMYERVWYFIIYNNYFIL